MQMERAVRLAGLTAVIGPTVLARVVVPPCRRLLPAGLRPTPLWRPPLSSSRRSWLPRGLPSQRPSRRLLLSPTNRPESSSLAGPWWMNSRETANGSDRLLHFAGRSGLPPLHAQPLQPCVEPVEAQ